MSRLAQEFPGIPSLLMNITRTKFPQIDMNSTANLEEAVEAMKTREAARELRRFIEGLIGKGFLKALVDERDEIMTNAMRNVPSGSTVVGVVGLAHLDGIERRWNEK